VRNLKDGFGHPVSPARRKSRVVKTGRADELPLDEPKVWLYVVDGRNYRDLSSLDATGVDWWAANPNTEKGDLILMYRSRPYSDIAYVFIAADDAQETKKTKSWNWDWGVKITGGFRLRRVITLDEIRKNGALKHWSFVRQQQGVMKVSKDIIEEGVWEPLREMLKDHGADLPEQFGPDWTERAPRKKVFISYVRENEKLADELRSNLEANRIDVFFDRTAIRPGQQWRREIFQEIKRSQAFVICLSPKWLRSRGFAKKELHWALARHRRRENYFFPVIVAKCTPPKVLSELQVIEMFGKSRKVGINALVSHLGQVVKR
jgi:hypothetical protein